MNIFFLHFDPKKCAEQHCDKHVVKMLLELVQLLYTAHCTLKSENIPENHYRPFNKNHPTGVWVRMCEENYRYTINLAIELSKEYTFRYNRIHKCDQHLTWLKNSPIFQNTVYNSKKKITFGCSKIGNTPIPLAMPDDCHRKYAIQSYRQYYNRYKTHFAKWTNRPEPYWFTPNRFLNFDKAL